MKKIQLIALLDKSHPPQHSFVDGMLATLIPDVLKWETYLIVSKVNEKSEVQYKGAKCLPVLQRRPSGVLKKIFSIFTSYRLIKNRTKNKNKNKNISNILFVRNDPFLLFGIKMVKLFVNSELLLVYQNSFPFEASYKNSMVRWVYLKLITSFPSLVDLYLTVSPLALHRIKVLTVNNHSSYDFIPLMSDFTPVSEVKNLELGATAEFIYIGTHSDLRRIDIVLEGICNALNSGCKANFTFVGGDAQQVKKLLLNTEIQYWVNDNRIKFLGKIDRDKIPNLLTKFDVGLSLIPRNNIYKESSPTKIVEYMSQGLATLSSFGIDLQEEFVEDSNSGILCEFDPLSITNSILDLASDVNKINVYKVNSLKFAKNNLSYTNYLSIFSRLCDGSKL